MNTSEFCVSEIGVGVTLGKGTKTWQYSTVGDGVVTGERCVIGSCAWVGKGVQMGDDCRIQHGAFIPNNTRLGNRVFIGPCAVLTDDKYPIVNNPNYKAQPPVIGNDVSIGAGAVICSGVTIGNGATIGAGAVVTKDVNAFTVVVGIPAKVMTED